MMHPINKKLKRVTRLVILPDYQGIGLGTKFLNAIGEMYTKEGYDFLITTSAKNLINALKKSNDWLLARYNIPKGSKTGMKELKRTARTKCKTASFFMKKVKKGK